MILDDFLSLDKLDEGIVQAKPEQLSAAACFEALNDVVHEMSVHCKTGQLIQTDFRGGGSVVIDERLLKNVCINLLSNAIKFSPENSTIDLTCDINPKNWCFQLKTGA